KHLYFDDGLGQLLKFGGLIMSQFNAGKLAYRAVIKILSLPLPLGQRLIRTCQGLRCTEPAKRIVQHDPALLSVTQVNIDFCENQTDDRRRK
uniref:Uncharacterized protein n=1 Tax=Athene cunicularia TaxID=194338 RepID=A0A663MEG9_ATHCN